MPIYLPCTFLPAQPINVVVNCIVGIEISFFHKWWIYLGCQSHNSKDTNDDIVHLYKARFYWFASNSNIVQQCTSINIWRFSDVWHLSILIINVSFFKYLVEHILNKNMALKYILRAYNMNSVSKRWLLESIEAHKWLLLILVKPCVMPCNLHVVKVKCTFIT